MAFMRSHKGKEPSKYAFFITLVIFYFFVTLIIYVVEYMGFINTNSSITLFGAIVGSSVPAFLAIYLSRYSEQARIARKQRFYLNIRIRKEISEERKRHFQDLVKKLEKINSFLEPIVVRTYPSNPLKIGELSKNNMEELIHCIQDNSIRNHLGKYYRGLDLEKLPSLSSDIQKFNLDVQKFEEEILKEAGKLLNAKDTFIFTDTARPENNKTSISKSSFFLTLINIWMDLQKNNNLTNYGYIQEYFPKRPDPSHLENKSVGDWTIETPRLKFRELVLTYTDNLYANYDVLDNIKKLLSNDALLKRFKSLYLRKEEIEDYKNKAREIIENLKEQIKSEEYNKIFDCCPYHEELI